MGTHQLCDRIIMSCLLVQITNGYDRPRHMHRHFQSDDHQLGTLLPNCPFLSYHTICHSSRCKHRKLFSVQNTLPQAWTDTIHMHQCVEWTSTQSLTYLINALLGVVVMLVFGFTHTHTLFLPHSINSLSVVVGSYFANCTNGSVLSR